MVMCLSVSHAENRVTGHWEGHIEIPGQPIAVKIDLASNDNEWTGTIDIPTQGANDLRDFGRKAQCFSFGI